MAQKGRARISTATELYPMVNQEDGVENAKQRVFNNYNIKISGCRDHADLALEPAERSVCMKS